MNSVPGATGTGRARRSGWGTVLAAVCCLCATAQDGWCGWTTFTTADGLGGNLVMVIHEDRLGNLWFGTSGGGVSRYDGLRWRTYTSADGLAQDFVTAIREDHSGNLWFGTNGGVSRFDGASWTRFTTADGLADEHVTSIFEDRSGNLWVGTQDGGVSRFDGTSWRTFTTADGLANNRVLSILQDHSGNLWFGTYLGGVSRFDGTSWATFTSADGLAHDVVQVILEDRAGNLWFGTTRGVSRFDGTTWAQYAGAERLGLVSVRAIYEDRAGDLWFAHFGGVSRFDGTTWRVFTYGDGFPGDSATSTNYANAIVEDLSGSIWIGSHSGASRFDRSTWKSYSSASGLGGDRVRAIHEDRSGRLWAGTSNGLGVSRFDGTTWKTFSVADGLAGPDVDLIVEDRSGNLWFATGFGASRYDGSAWMTAVPGSDVNSILEDRVGNLWFATFGDGAVLRDAIYGYEIHFTVVNGLPSNFVNSIVQDSAANVWVGTDAGVCRFDGVGWRTFTTTDGLSSDHIVRLYVERSGNLWGAGYDGSLCRYDGTSWRLFQPADANGYPVMAFLEDRAANLWFGSSRKVYRFDGTTWMTLTRADGLAASGAYSMVEDQSGNIWIGTAVGATRYDGTTYRNLTTTDGLVSAVVSNILQDHSGTLWFGTPSGLSRYEADRIPPQTVFLSAPPRLTAARDLTVLFAAAFGEADRVEFSYRLDGGAWSAWSSLNSRYLTGVADGVHTFEARSRDYMVNTDSTPARAAFEIDATPPAPVIASPAFGQAVRAQVEVRGTAADARFAGYRLQARPQGASSWESPPATLLAESSTPVVGGRLGAWDTSALRDGLYELRLSVTDSLGLTGVYVVTVIVDNHAPWASVTSPARVTSEAGGDVYTTDAEAHLYLPPRGLAEDAVVTIAALGAGDVPPGQAGGAELVLPGYRLDWGGVRLRKSATLEVSYAGSEAGAGKSLALYVAGRDSVWRRLGGTVDASTRRISLAVTEEGRYALYAETGAAAGPGGLGKLSLTPRVFSPRGTYAQAEIGIGFTLGRAATVTVKVYNRAGRLVREVTPGQAFGPGANLVRWNGRDRDGAIVEPGLYIVAVQALGETQSRPVAVVR